ncbi:hypothetical protein N301_08735, partial [Charadrius vociferus]
PECADNVQFWDRPSRIFAGLLTPGVAAAKALTDLEKMACWSIKQFNLTSEIITSLLTDVDSIRHAVLQDRAAIDFLLLAQGHGCEDFEQARLNLIAYSYSVACCYTMLINMLKENVGKV